MNISFILTIYERKISRDTRDAYRKAPISHIRISKFDHHKEDLLPIFEPVCDMIEGRLAKDKAILVHCALGYSRSATVVIAYGKRMAQFSQANDNLRTTKSKL